MDSLDYTVLCNVCMYNLQGCQIDMTLQYKKLKREGNTVTGILLLEIYCTSLLSGSTVTTKFDL
jgi:hypothetical protein